MSKTMFEKVRDFHIAFGQRVGVTPELPDMKERSLRMKLLQEEMREYIEAEGDDNLVEIADALADIIYIVVGSAISYGIPLDEIFNEVHNSNMSKLVDGKVLRRDDGKVIKPEGWVSPDIAGILKSHS